MWFGIKKGDSHKNYCEDSLFLLETTPFIIGGVFDGCSSGINSHVASGMLSSAFKNSFENWMRIISKRTVFDNLTIDEVNIPIKDGIKDFLLACSVLGFKELECLSTAIVFIYNKQNSTLLVYVLGDGFLFINGKTIEFTSVNNEPDYVAYHFKDSNIEDYLKDRTYTYTNVKNFAVATDGIGQINPVFPGEIDIIEFLIHDTFLSNSASMLQRKFNMLRSSHRFDDDVAIIRYDGL